MSRNTIRFRVFENPDSACAHVAAEMAQLIRERAILGRTAVIGLATGKSQLPLFAELIYLHREEGLSFQNVICFNLDEYAGLTPDHPESCRSFIQSSLFDFIDLPKKNIHALRSDLAIKRTSAHSKDYERKIIAAGGIDIQLLGIGRNGHIGFNEPGALIDSRTARVEIAEMTRSDAYADFGKLKNVPTHALTMGCGTILQSRKIILLAWGMSKSRVIRRAIHGPVTPKLPASYLQKHPAAHIYLDPPAASVLLGK